MSFLPPWLRPYGLSGAVLFVPNQQNTACSACVGQDVHCAPPATAPSSAPNSTCDAERCTQPRCAPKDLQQRQQSAQKRDALLTACPFNISLALLPSLPLSLPASLPPSYQGSRSQATNRITQNFSAHSSRSLTSRARDKPSAMPTPPPLKQSTKACGSIPRPGFARHQFQRGVLIHTPETPTHKNLSLSLENCSNSGGQFPTTDIRKHQQA